MSDIPILSILIILPAIAAIFLLFLEVFITKNHKKNLDIFSKYCSLSVAFIELILTLLLYIDFKPNHWMQFNEQYDWIKLGGLNISILLGIDGISLSFLLLNAVLMPICMLASWKYITKKIKFHELPFTEDVKPGFFIYFSKQF